MTTEIKESFQWAAPLSFYKEEAGGGKLYRGRAITATITGNKRKYKREELKLAARSLSDRPVNLNHKKPLSYPENQTLDCDYEGNAVEYILRLRDKEAIKLVDEKKIKHTSIEGHARSSELVDGIAPVGIVFTGLALVTEDERPGDPMSSIELWEIEPTEEVPLSEIELGEPYPNEHACRLRDPDEFQSDSFRRISQGKLNIIIGRPKGKDTTTAQAYRYPKGEWSEDEARSHCREHGGRFEAASEIAGTDSQESLTNKKEEEKKMAEQTTKLEEFGDADFPDSCFAYVPESAKGSEGNKSERKLPHHNKDGSLSPEHVRNALARLPQSDIPQSEWPAIQKHLEAHMKDINPDYEPSETASFSGTSVTVIPTVRAETKEIPEKSKEKVDVYDEIKKVTRRSVDKAMELDSKINKVRDLLSETVDKLKKDVDKMNQDVKNYLGSGATKGEIAEAISKLDMKITEAVTEDKRQLVKLVETLQTAVEAHLKMQDQKLDSTTTEHGEKLKKIDEVAADILKKLQDTDAQMKEISGKVESSTKLVETVKATFEDRATLSKTFPFKGKGKQSTEEKQDAGDEDWELKRFREKAGLKK